MLGCRDFWIALPTAPLTAPPTAPMTAPMMPPPAAAPAGPLAARLTAHKEQDRSDNTMLSIRRAFTRDSMSDCES
jgi:hypothetical protein